MKSLYFLVDLFTVIIPVAFSFHPKLMFYRYFKPFIIGNILSALVFIGWDILFTGLGVWGFNPDYISGFHLFNLPVEEILFFFAIPYACVFTYHCLNLFFDLQRTSRTIDIVYLSFATCMLVLGLYFHDRLYTASVFISLSLLLFALKLFARMEWFTRLAFVYPVLLIPFFVVNGILTGTGPDQPVVFYNNSENMGIRLFTIPIEDIFYGFELMLLNVFLYEFFKVWVGPKQAST